MKKNGGDAAAVFAKNTTGIADKNDGKVAGIAVVCVDLVGPAAITDGVTAAHADSGSSAEFFHGHAAHTKQIFDVVWLAVRLEPDAIAFVHRGPP